MKINTTPVWNHDAKTVTLKITDEQYEDLKRVDFNGLWFVLRLRTGKVVE